LARASADVQFSIWYVRSMFVVASISSTLIDFAERLADVGFVPPPDFA